MTAAAIAVPNPDDAAIVTAIISLSHSLKLHVIAERVETREQVDFLRMHQCDEMQVYYFSKPVAARGLEQMLRRRSTLAIGYGSAAE